MKRLNSSYMYALLIAFTLSIVWTAPFILGLKAEVPWDPLWGSILLELPVQLCVIALVAIVSSIFVFAVTSPLVRFAGRYENSLLFWVSALAIVMVISLVIIYYVVAYVFGKWLFSQV